MKISCIYNDGKTLDFTQDDASNYKNINRKKLESVVLFSNGKEIDSITFPKGYTFAYRTRSLGKFSDPKKEKYVILGAVNKNNQILHFINNDGQVEIIDTPEEFAKYGKIKLTNDEAI